MKVILLDSVDWKRAEKFTGVKRVIEDTIQRAADEALGLLDFASEFINITVQPNQYSVTPGYDTGGYTVNSEFLTISFHPDIPKGVDNLKQELRATVFHEMNHAARWNVVAYDEQLIVDSIFEGLATVFERDYADYRPLYAHYEDDETMKKWCAEILSVGSFSNPKYNELKFEHPDGRRWVVYKTGTWIIDKAKEASGKSIIELTKLSADEIKRMAKIEKIVTAEHTELMN